MWYTDQVNSILDSIRKEEDYIMYVKAPKFSKLKNIETLHLTERKEKLDYLGKRLGQHLQFLNAALMNERIVEVGNKLSQIKAELKEELIISQDAIHILIDTARMVAKEKTAFLHDMGETSKVLRRMSTFSLGNNKNASSSEGSTPSNSKRVTPQSDQPADGAADAAAGSAGAGATMMTPELVIDTHDENAFLAVFPNGKQLIPPSSPR